ncbi:MAG: GNAT family N-acetyltransferase [Anaerolineae bacterium]
MPILETPRLILRRPEMEDALAIYEHMQERDIAANTLLIPYPHPAGAAEEWISRTQQAYNDGEGYNFGVILKAEDRLIGAIGLGLRTDHRRAEMGYWLGKPYWDRVTCQRRPVSLVAFASKCWG